MEQYNNKDVLTQIYILKQGLIDEEAARIAADEELGRRIDAEEAARIAADLVLQTNIDAEAAARIAADIVLGDRIDAEEAARIAADNQLQANIDAEEAARIAADNQLQSNIDAEEAARIAGDADLNTRLNQEEAARLAADYALGERITNEENARIAADNQLLTRIATEESNREAADNALGARIDAEAAARIAAVDDIIMELTTQQGKLDTEIADRIAGDSALSDRIDTEEAARIAADNGKLDIAPSGTRAGRVVQTKEGGGYEWVKRTETGVYTKNSGEPLVDFYNWSPGDRIVGAFSLRGTDTLGNSYYVIISGEFSLSQKSENNGNEYSGLRGFGRASIGRGSGIPTEYVYVSSILKSKNIASGEVTYTILYDTIGSPVVSPIPRIVMTVPDGNALFDGPGVVVRSNM